MERMTLRTIKTLPNRPMRKNSSEGSVTMEYIIVSSFALLVSISAVTWIGKVIKERVEKMATKVGSDAAEFDVGWEDE
jgi:hypothetical protein